MGLTIGNKEISYQVFNSLFFFLYQICVYLIEIWCKLSNGCKKSEKKMLLWIHIKNSEPKKNKLFI